MDRTFQFRPLLEFCFFALTVSAVAHFLYSSLGYNPTDDGFTLAYSRRILEGQIPHRDFILIRPFLSPLLHIPFVYLGGEYTYYASRYFVWFQFASLAWIWSFVVDCFLEKPFSLVERLSLALVIFALTANTFPVMAWHTIDGFFLSSIGLVFCLRDSQMSKLAGYALIASACLCKQSFILLAPATLFILGDWRKVKFWVAIVLPAAAYVTFLLLTGAVGDAIAQLGSQRGILGVGVKQYLSQWMTFPGVILGYFLFRLVVGHPQVRTGRMISQVNQKTLAKILIFLVPVVGSAISMGLVGESNVGLYRSSFGLFGMAAGVVLFLILEQPKTSDKRGGTQIALLVLLTSWSVSISLGYNTPALASGILVALLITQTLTIPSAFRKRTRTALFILAAIVLTSAFAIGRRSNVYREQPAGKLVFDLHDVLPGGSGIRTNANTYEFLVDLKRAVGVAESNGLIYAVIPDNAGFWVKNPQLNPLPADWIQGTELSKENLINRVILSLDSQRGDLAVVTQKIKAADLREGFHLLLDDNHFAIVQYVRSHFEKFSETEFFELYR